MKKAPAIDPASNIIQRKRSNRDLVSTILVNPWIVKVEQYSFILLRIPQFSVK